MLLFVTILCTAITGCGGKTSKPSESSNVVNENSSSATDVEEPEASEPEETEILPDNVAYYNELKQEYANNPKTLNRFSFGDEDEDAVVAFLCDDGNIFVYNKDFMTFYNPDTKESKQVPLCLERLYPCYSDNQIVAVSEDESSYVFYDTSGNIIKELPVSLIDQYISEYYDEKKECFFISNGKIFLDTSGEKKTITVMDTDGNVINSIPYPTYINNNEVECGANQVRLLGEYKNKIYALCYLKDYCICTMDLDSGTWEEVNGSDEITMYFDIQDAMKTVGKFVFNQYFIYDMDTQKVVVKSKTSYNLLKDYVGGTSSYASGDRIRYLSDREIKYAADIEEIEKMVKLNGSGVFIPIDEKRYIHAREEGCFIGNYETGSDAEEAIYRN